MPVPLPTDSAFTALAMRCSSSRILEMGKRSRRAQRAAADVAELPDGEPHGEVGFVWLFLGVLLMVPIVPWPFLHWNVFTFEIFPPAEALVFGTLSFTASLFALKAMRRHFRQLTFQPLDL